MMQPADLGELDDHAWLGGLYRTTVWRVLLEREVATPPVVVARSRSAPLAA
jgi:hypothetical protein